MTIAEPAPEQSTFKGVKRLSEGGQSLKLSSKGAFFNRESLLIRVAKHVDRTRPIAWHYTLTCPRRPGGNVHRLQILREGPIHSLSQSYLTCGWLPTR